MLKRKFGKTNLEVTPIGLGTWVFGGWPWNEINEKECEAALETAIGAGINLIDTAPIYGFGRSEEIVGRTLRRLKVREKIVLATKQGFSWDDGKKRNVRKDCSKKAVFREIDESLKRLQTDWIDIYQIHWPDENTPIGETMEAMLKLKDQGKIKVIGVCNYNAEQMKECLKYAPLESSQPPYNYFQRDIEKEILPFCIEHKFGTLTYGTLCKGLLTGKFGIDKKPNDPVRQQTWDPIFETKRYEECLAEIEKLKKQAAEENLTVGQWVIRWAINQPGVTCALVGARNPKQVKENTTI
ncbi:MAG: hypothetical protein A2W61_00080 [Deltaproteobacteria bacterium RIFCSPLOWO2_01_44_7]|nr:MAG: hypothetical protein A2712_00880 [Deltaproteobacteria bacterium RIFCSPHIGHO2_01_FULL_43_49]OGQ15304.1 MAG: hypothetical protein A3D22_04595 [Deltaproteobacteria bacterium RIFCSPHIGHO2_02_FULL_44_53]OGQ27072.1 MAG: hypothetical protein A3D98_01470 [Deltaproteobacteria bacterium RIFCSPHIGHO2_12_FULL_44_21]OGQ31820.1 MAG: hypothetical protein A2979_05755 [Deltaproteobacteria bacterium RIFCSPLOWO2_01_FULL_45_74]OGQ37634.1 MAG: hypothetical protein A2W61_00080 [Deltaproteobacteria bacterium 